MNSITVPGELDDAAETLLRMAAALPEGEAVFEADSAPAQEAADKLVRAKLIDLVDVQTKVILEGPNAGGYRREFFKINDAGKRKADELGGPMEVDDLDDLAEKRAAEAAERAEVAAKA